VEEAQVADRTPEAALLLALLPIVVTVFELAPREVDPCRLADPTALVRRTCAEGPAGLRGSARLLFGARLDANRATAAELELLPGIGPARAAAIVAERQRAPYASLDGLRRVHGIGPKIVERLRAWLQAGSRLESRRSPADASGSLADPLADPGSTPQALGEGR
jgi:competence ComEA-like helix-hairpin-helix protein